MKNIPYVITILVAFAFSSCSENDPESKIVEIPTVVKQPLQAPAKVFSGPEISAVGYGSVPPNNTGPYSIHTDSETRFVTLSGIAEDTQTTGRTSGVSFTLGGNWENLVGGKLIKVSITAQASGPGVETFWAAYSTSDNGNSGWKEFKATNVLQTFEFEYEVPQVIHGNLDFIGIVPDADKNGTGIVIHKMFAQAIN